MEPLKIEQHITEKDYSELLIFIMFGRKKINKLVLLIITPILGVVTLLIFLFLGEPDFISIFMSIFLIVFGPLFRFLTPYLWRRMYRKSPILQEKCVMEFKEDEFEVVSKRGSSKFAYSEITELYETSKFFLIYIGKANAIHVNRVNIDKSSIAQIRQLLLKYVGKKYFDRTKK